MCIICLEFDRMRDLEDAWRMLASARREPQAIPHAHLDALEKALSDRNPDDNSPLMLDDQ